MREHIPLLLTAQQLNESVTEFVSASVCVCVWSECLAVTPLTPVQVKPMFSLSNRHFATIQKWRGTEI